MTRKPKPASTAEATPSPVISVTAQQSRFHTDAADAPTTTEIDVKDLSITIGRKEVLSHASLHLRPGGHYVLVGRNGTGKSTLLKAVAEGLIPGIPWNLRIQLLGQTNLDIDDSSQDNEAETVLRHVVRSDRMRERLLREAEVLSSAIGEQNDTTAAFRAWREVSHQRLTRELEEARRIAERRSGARGAKARRELNSVEEKHESSEKSILQSEDDISADELSEGTRAAVEMLTEIQTSLDLMSSSSAEQRATKILLGLGFSRSSITQPLSNLSGGWRTRCSLASALHVPSDILLLDEPTNYLDLPSILWLESYVSTLPITAVTVTHDRSFATAVGQYLLILRNAHLELFNGSLSAFERERNNQIKWLSRMKNAQERQKSHMQASIDSSLRAAKRTGDDKKLKQVANRKKKLDERMGLQVSAKGGRFKLNRDLAGYHLSNRDAIEVPDWDPPVRLVLPAGVPDLRFPGAVVSLENVGFAYPTVSKLDAKKTVLRDVDLTIHLGDRVGVVGLNGAGKSTLVSLLCPSPKSAISPTTGTVTRHPRAVIARFSQNAVDELAVLAAASPPSLTALSHILSLTSPGTTEQNPRALLSGLGLVGNTASDVPVALLSGGQKVRLALAALLVDGPPHLLVLDEITTHLDSETISALVKALDGFEGALLVITHDRVFMREVVERQKYELGGRGDDESDDSDSDSEDQEKRGTVYWLAKGKLKVLENGMDQYEEIAEKASSKLGAL